ncbi:hypothetical protein [Bacillus sp. S/N-304-OC-R1]|uniref:hypothetical protein n=1 Tax=Bacillus sp. S/N-304-OC-R1 TaxID=2758034 RepID=UPI001C8DCD4C|nr:hypothetical protein [Bacillus sp. S/N-304-OC-R1]MBY0120375.1 hypothetical protein [Bacillus sp. S/N-304-OC-R1]
MEYFTDHLLFELVYEDILFEHLEFIRIDHICDVCYITLKNVITSAVYTFEQNKIKSLRKKFYRYPQNSKKKKNHIAVSH